MRKYECTYLVSDEVPESDLNKTTGKIAGIIADLGGKVEKEDIWGRRKLAYPIKKQDFATYITLYFELPADKAQEFERDLRLTAHLLRQLVVVAEQVKEEITLSASDIAGTEDIKEVVGGEKSFEAIEGETEKSKDLMAKREEQTVEDEETETETIEEEKPEIVEAVASDPEIEEIVKKPKTRKAKVLAPVSPDADEKEETPVVEEKKTAKKAAAPKTEKKPAKKKEVTDEVERLSKLNDELDDILKDEL